MPPNLILITTDQQRFDAVGANGSDFLDTPNLDILAHEGVNFQRAYCPNTVCTPSRVSLMTGDHLSRHGSYNIGVMPISTDRFLSNRLRRVGYHTGHVGKGHWHSWQHEDSPEYGKQPAENFAATWNDFVGFDCAEIGTGHGSYGIGGHYLKWALDKGIDPRQAEHRPLWKKDPNGTGNWDLPTALHHGQWTVERSLALLRDRPQDQPFFFHIGFQDPLHPHLLPRDFTRRVDPGSVPPPAVHPSEEVNSPPHLALFRDGTLQDSRFRGPHEVAGQGRAEWGEYFENEHYSRQTRAYYYSMIHLLDDQLGQLWAGLRELGLWDNTVIAFTSDHGEMLGDHGIGQKGPLCFEGVAKVPFLMRAPEWFAPQRVEECVSLVDVAPTFLELAGVAPDLRCPMDGLSWVSRLREGTPIDRPGVRLEYKEEADRIRYRAWVTPEWKLCIYLGETFGELYHLAEDPDERVNRFDDPACQTVRAELTRQLLEDMERSDPMGERFTRV